MKNIIGAAAVSLALSVSSALAADLPLRKEAPAYAPPAPLFSWTGLYGGVNIGYGFGAGDQDRGANAYLGYPGASPLVQVPLGSAWSIQNDLNGVLGGGQVGYNYQINPWLVVGLETDIQAADVHSQGWGGGAAPASPAFGALLWDPHASTAYQTKSVDWFGSLRGRVGVTAPNMPNLLIFASGGLAYGGVVHNFAVSDVYPTPPAALIFGGGSNYDDTKVGWTVGGGLEWRPLISHPLFSAFSVKVEYLYTDLGSTTVNGVSLASFFPVPAALPVFGYAQTSQTRFHTVRVGLNWHFNPFPTAPVVAKY